MPFRSALSVAGDALVVQAFGPAALRRHAALRHRASGAITGVLLASLCLPAPAAAETIDRVLAVVNGSVITLSDVDGARRFGLVDAPAGDLRSAIDRLIDRRLALVEVERYAPPEPPSARIDEAVATARARFSSDAAFNAALAETGLTLDQLRRHVRDDLRRRTYEQQRFAFMSQPTDEETLAYYRQNQDRFKRGGRVPPYDEIRIDVRATLAAVRQADAVREWLAGLRRRAEISILPS